MIVVLLSVCSVFYVLDFQSVITNCNKKQMELDNIMNNRIGLGSFQLRCFIILCLVDMNDGVQLVLSSFLNTIIKASFPGATSEYISSLASIFYFGILCGSITSGHLADIYGRRRLINTGAFLQMCVAILFYFANTLTLMFILRFFYGFCFGFTVAITTSMFAEVTPEKYRGKGILLINFCISIGKLYGVVLGYIFLADKINETNWKLMMICGSFPNLIVLYGSQFILTQSPRFLLVNKRFQEGFQTLNTMIKANKQQNAIQLSDREKQKLTDEYSIEIKGQSSNFMVLFNHKYLKITISLSICWLIINFCFYGQLIIEALHINTTKGHIKSNLSKYFFTVFGEIPSLFVAFFMIDNPRFGRKFSLVIYFIGAGIFHSLFGITKLTAMGSIARFFMKDVFQILYPLTTESFQTKIRTKGFGFCSGFGRIGSILMPFILIPLDDYSQSSVYFLFGILSLVACAVSYFQIAQTLNKSLDEVKPGNLLEEKFEIKQK